MFFAENFPLFTRPNLGHIHPGIKAKGNFGNGVGKRQPFGAKLLMGKTRREGGGGITEILGISQNGVAHMGTMDPQLMGPAGDGLQCKFT